jgi:protein TonB
MRVTARISIVAVTLILAVGALGAQAQVHHPGNGVTLPVVVSEVKADYTPEAKAAGIQGTVGLDTVVLADGTVGDVTVAQSLDGVHGLDDQAVKAMKQWRFKPGLKDGKPVAVLVAVEMTFTLK